MHADCTLWILFLRPGFTRVANLPMIAGSLSKTEVQIPCQNQTVTHVDA